MYYLTTNLTRIQCSSRTIQYLEYIALQETPD